MNENVIKNFGAAHGSTHSDRFLLLTGFRSPHFFQQQHLRDYTFCDGISAIVFRFWQFCGAIYFQHEFSDSKKIQIISLVSHFVIRIDISRHLLSHFVSRHSIHL